ncbi:MAG TPA: glutathione S-transferase N-terminal domain-containing protein [Burkholderiales bacterium]|nr:glutathione S-transferase N-terminal domain-containing protein [Burkholderiales bacterium]
MIRLYFHPSPNPMKVLLLLEEAGIPYELVPVDTRKGQQHDATFRAINPNGKVPAIVDTEGAGGKEIAVFDSNAILLYLGDKYGKFTGKASDRGDMLSWLMFVATGIGPYSGQSVHFQRAAPEQIPYAINRYRREADRHYRVLDDHLKGREWIVGNEYGIVDMCGWGWIDRATFVFHGDADPLSHYPNVKRWFGAIESRPAVARVRAAAKTLAFKQEMDEEAKRALFPSNYPLPAA